MVGGWAGGRVNECVRECVRACASVNWWVGGCVHASVSDSEGG
jgi:hypothetical protein